MVAILMMLAKLATLGLRETKIFQSKCYEVIVSVFRFSLFFKVVIIKNVFDSYSS